MQLNEFQDLIRKQQPNELSRTFLDAPNVAAFPNQEDFTTFQNRIREFYPDAEQITVAGTANWMFSLSPKKNFKTYDKKSDVDTVVISPVDFNRFWEEIRYFHRRRYYAISKFHRDRLLRNGQNIYSGFVTPCWIPDRTNQTKYEHERTLDKLSDNLVDFRSVNMFFFKNLDEAVDYYQRGFRIAKGKL